MVAHPIVNAATIIFQLRRCWMRCFNPHIRFSLERPEPYFAPWGKPEEVDGIGPAPEAHPMSLAYSILIHL